MSDDWVKKMFGLHDGGVYKGTPLRPGETPVILSGATVTGRCPAGQGGQRSGRRPVRVQLVLLPGVPNRPPDQPRHQKPHYLDADTLKDTTTCGYKHIR